ncbi:MAG TPA: hypothetical protein VIJ93_05935, partial [bacterium]
TTYTSGFGLTNGYTCKTWSVMVLYTDPAQTTDNVVALADGNNVWHIEDDGGVGPVSIKYGQAPTDTLLDWTCAGVSCAGSLTRFSAIGGNELCGHTRDPDQIEPWGSGPVSGAGGPALFSGPPFVLDCSTGPDQVAKVRDYYPNSDYPPSVVPGTQLEWGMPLINSLSKTTYWQQVLATQMKCPVIPQCSVTDVFNQTFNGAPPGWITGNMPVTQPTNWVESGGHLSKSNSCWGTYGSQLLNNQVASGPGTLLVELGTGSQTDEGILFNYNRGTGNGYALHFQSNACNSGGNNIIFGKYVGVNFTTITTAAMPNIACADFYVQLIINGCNFTVSAGTTPGTLVAVATFTDCSYSGGQLGFDGGHCGSYHYDSFQFTGICVTPTPTSTPTKTPSNTPTQTPTPTSTSTATLTATKTATATTTNSATNTTTNSATATATLTTTQTATKTATATTTNSATSTATNSATATATLTTTQTATQTATVTAVNTATSTFANTATATAVNTATSTATQTATLTMTQTVTKTATATTTNSAT